MRNNKLFLSVIVAIMAFFLTSALRAQEQATKKVGGPCTYKAIKGACKIVSIEKTDSSKKQADMTGGPGYEGYEVKFIFVPEKPADFSDVTWAKGAENAILSTQYPMQLANSWYPSERFLQKYNIKKDTFVVCEMELITSGTCTPIVFKFGGINTTDYLE